MALKGENPVRNGGNETPYAAGAIVIGSLAILILIRRGFRGVNLGGASISIK